MRHLVKGKKLGRNTSHRHATMKAMSCSLIEHKSIQTTVTKAKELRRYVEPIITRAKEDTSHNRRQAFSSLQDKHAVNTLFNEVAPAVGDRPGGYTRVLKLGFRVGDSAEMALIELVDFSDYEPEKKSAKKKRTRRAGKSNKPDTSAQADPKEKETAKAEKPVEAKDTDSDADGDNKTKEAVADDANVEDKTDQEAEAEAENSAETEDEKASEDENEKKK